VQRAVDLPVPGARQPVADLVAGGGVERGGAVPRREVALGGEPVMSPTSINSRAAPDGPMPCTVSNEVPVASMSSRSSLSADFFRA
jgi:hypothetical protein